MLTPFGTGSEAIPYAARLSSSYAAGEVTTKEYNGAQRMAVLEDSMKRPFCEATWADVQIADVALMPWASLDRIVQVKIKDRLAFPGLDGKRLVHIEFEFAGDPYSGTFDPDDTVYIQQR